MEKVVRRYLSFEAADKADDEFYASLTPAQRIEILTGLIVRAYEGENAPQKGSLRVPFVFKRVRS